MGELKPTRMKLQLVDRSIAIPRGVLENILVKVEKFIFPADFVVLDMEEDQRILIILGRPFLATGGALIDVQKGELTMRVQDEQLTFSVYSAMGFPGEDDREESVNLLEQICSEKFLRHLVDDSLVAVLLGFDVDDEEEAVEYTQSLDSYYAERQFFRKIEPIEMPEKSKAAQPSIVEPPELELK